MSFTVSITLPFDQIEPAEEFGSLAAVRQVSETAEKAGFYGGCVTDHPVPSYRWLDSGGHYAQDPFVMLSMVAAFTTRLRLQTGILVLPYRNPFITARMVSSLDVMSGGRVELGLGAGYLKPEYKALGVDFDSRNEITDEYIRAMKVAWTGEDFAFEGTGYTAVGNRMRPAPTQQPHPPLLVGGNSRRAIRRAVDVGDGWIPFFSEERVSTTSRTASMANNDELKSGIAYLQEYAASAGRPVPPKIVCWSVLFVGPDFSAEEAIDRFAGLRDLGVSGAVISIPTKLRNQWCDIAAKFGETVLPHVN
jgi:probable F420-dependent oxidoreductase